MQTFDIGSIPVGAGAPLLWMLGPCAMESEALVRESAAQIAEVMGERPWIFSSSYDKANRMSSQSFRGPGIEQGLEWLLRVKQEYGIPVLTDVHTPEEAIRASAVVDVLQIPAFLCRQTDLVEAAARTGCALQIKKGQFMAPWDMQPVLQKAVQQGNRRVILCERGSSFGYNNLVVDFRSLGFMQESGFPVSMDASHACMLPGSQGSSSGGLRRFVPAMARAAAAVGVQALYLEVHPHPERALSDAGTQLSFEGLRTLVHEVEAIHTSLAELSYVGCREE